MFFRHGFTTFCTAVCIALLCLSPGSGMPESPFWGMDKLVHAFLFMVLAFQMLTFFQKQYSLYIFRLIPVKATIIISIFYAALIELFQSSFVINREGDLFDLAADIIGLGLGLFAFRFIHGKLNYKLYEKFPSKHKV